MFKGAGLAMAAASILALSAPYELSSMSRNSDTQYERQSSGKQRKNKAQRQARKVNRKKK